VALVRSGEFRPCNVIVKDPVTSHRSHSCGPSFGVDDSHDEHTNCTFQKDMVIYLWSVFLVSWHARAFRDLRDSTDVSFN